MKKILVTTLVAGALVVSAFAQGTVTFTANKGTLKYTTDGTTLANVPVSVGTAPAQIAGYGNFNLALYAAPKGTAISMSGAVPDLSGWTLASPILKQVAPFAGGMANSVVTIPASLSGAEGGTTVQLVVVGWSGDAATFADAAKGTGLIGWSGDSRFANTGALGWNQGTGTVNPPSTVFVATGATGFQGLTLAPIPEPSAIALAGLGAAALLIFRRRK